MKSAKYSFRKTSDVVESLVCAAALMCAMFSVLPVSISAERKPEKRSEPIKVYSLAAASETQKSASPTPRQGKVLPTPSSSSTESSVQMPSPEGIIPAGANLPIPDAVGAGADFGIANFNTSATAGIAIFEIESLDKIPARLNSPRPKYPRELLRRGVEGNVVLCLTIAADGHVESAEVEKSDNPLFSESARDCALKLKYEPPLKNGTPVRARFLLPMPFNIYK